MLATTIIAHRLRNGLKLYSSYAHLCHWEFHNSCIFFPSVFSMLYKTTTVLTSDLLQEIKVLRTLKHPNIVQYYGSEVVGILLHVLQLIKTNQYKYTEFGNNVCAFAD